MWPFGKKTAESALARPKYLWEKEGYGFSDYEKWILLKVEEMENDEAFSCFWCSSWPSNTTLKCPYCSGPIVEIYHPGRVDSGLAARISDGLFCLRCSAELVCAIRGCSYEAGDILIGDSPHWGRYGVGHSSYKLKKRGRNLRDIIVAKLKEIESAKKSEDSQKHLRPLEPEDEYAALERRMDEIVEEEHRLEEEKDKIKKRMWEIDYAIAELMLSEVEDEPRLLRAADGDKEIVAEAEAEVEEIAPDKPEN